MADAGRTRTYEPGLPNFDMETVVRFEDGRPVVDVYTSIPYQSLVFVNAGDRYAAEYEAVARLTDRDTKDLAVETTETQSLSVANFDSTQSYATHVEVRQLEVPPGSYVSEVLITDAKTGAMARRRQGIVVPSPDPGEPFVGRILMEGKGADGRYHPLVALHLPALVDSVRATIRVANVPVESALEVTMRLLRFESDTTTASPPYWIVPTRASLAYQGAFFDRADTLQVTRRTLAAPVDNAEIVFSLPRMPVGIYRIEVEGRGAAGDDMMRQERLLSVKGPAFPQVVVLDDLVSALAYIAFEREIEAINAGGSAAEKKRRLDAFWGSLIPNRNAAANLIKLYYGRIEEANRFFTGYKEGWKTDRGMIYTIFGPPLYVDERVEMEIWHYSYSDRDPVNTFVFERVRPFDDEPFDNYILQRRPYYQHEWSRAVDRMRDGEVL